MSKYKVYAIATASWLVGEYEADSGDAALALSDDDPEARSQAYLCHQCADVEVGDPYEWDATEISPIGQNGGSNVETD